MFKSTRAALAVGLGLVGVAGVVSQSIGQGTDGNVRPTTGTAPAATRPATPAVIGTLDQEAVMKGYKKFMAITEQLKGEALARHNELLKLANEAKSTGEMLSKLQPGSPDAKKYEDKITSLKAQFEAGREQAEREFTQKEAEAYAMILNEIRAMAGGVAKQKGITMVTRYTPTQASASEPKTVMDAMTATVVYADPSMDITQTVLYWLNERYKAAGGVEPKAAAAPATATAPAAAQPR